MTERERLIELLLKNKYSCRIENCKKCGWGDKCFIYREADYLLENGVIVPPYKVGDSCYPLPRYKTPIVERKISRITYSKRNIIIGYYENDGQWRPPLRTRTLCILFRR